MKETNTERMTDLEVADILEELGFSRYFRGAIRAWNVYGTYHTSGFSVEVSDNMDELITIRLYKGSFDFYGEPRDSEKWFPASEPFCGKYFADVPPDKVRDILERIAKGEFSEGRFSHELSAEEHAHLLTVS